MGFNLSRSPGRLMDGSLYSHSFFSPSVIQRIYLYPDITSLTSAALLTTTELLVAQIDKQKVRRRVGQIIPFLLVFHGKEMLFIFSFKLIQTAVMERDPDQGMCVVLMRD